MDHSNLRDVLALDPHHQYADKIRLLRPFDTESTQDEVPDPYYSGVVRVMLSWYTLSILTRHQNRIE